MLIKTILKFAYNKGFQDALTMSHEKRYAEPQRELMQKSFNESEIAKLLPELQARIENDVRSKSK